MKGRVGFAMGRGRPAGTRRVINNNNADLADRGLRAYHHGDFEAAIKHLSKLTKKKTELWKCRLYLAMAYYRVSKTTRAVKELNDINTKCPIRDVREKAIMLLQEVSPEDQPIALRPRKS
jgi:hypothetical protein